MSETTAARIWTDEDFDWLKQTRHLKERWALDMDMDSIIASHRALAAERDRLRDIVERLTAVHLSSDIARRREIDEARMYLRGINTDNRGLPQ